MVTEAKTSGKEGGDEDFEERGAEEGINVAMATFMIACGPVLV